MHVYLDEYRRLASVQTTTLLYEARKANVGLTVAMQSFADLESDTARQAVLQDANRLAFRTTHEVAKAVAIGFAQPPRVVPVKKGICQNPVEYLLSHTHENPEVRALTQAFLAFQLNDMPGRFFPDLDKLLPGIKAELNKVLVDVMEGRLKPGSGELVYQILLVFFSRFRLTSLNFHIAAITTAAFLMPGSREAKYVSGLLSQHTSLWRDFIAKLFRYNDSKYYRPHHPSYSYLVAEFVSIYLDGPTTTLSLATAKQFGLTGAGVRAGEQEADKRQRARARKELAIHPEARFSDLLAEEKRPPFYVYDRNIHVSVVLTDAQREAITDYYRQPFLEYVGEEKTDDELRARYPQQFRFLVDAHQLCVLLAKEPIEVSAGPQEERQQTTADVINEVERQLTQLGTGEAFCALLQDDHTINAAKTTLPPAPALPPGNPALIAKIRSVSRQRFSRPRVEIDAKTAWRQATTPYRPVQDTTAGPAASPQPHQTQPTPPGAGTGRPAAQSRSTATRTPPPGRQQPRQPQPQSPPDPPQPRQTWPQSNAAGTFDVPPIGRRS